MNELKSKLIDLGCFIDNEFLDLYCSIIENNRATASQKHVTESHHILQRAYFKLNNLEVDDSADNRVNLSHFDHCLAHYYLCLCTSGRLKYLSEHAFIKMVKIETRFEFDLDKFMNQAKYYADIYASFCKHQGEATSQRPGTVLGKHCYTNGKIKVFRYECPDGFWPSCSRNTKLSEETKSKMSESAKRRCANPEYSKKLSNSLQQYYSKNHGSFYGKIWINDGITEAAIESTKTIPEGWVKGRLKRNWTRITNGIENKVIIKSEPIPDGWWIGQTNNKKEK